MTRYLATLALVASAAGCTTASLERRTVSQAVSVSDMRYQEIVDDFALLADDPGALPSFALLAQGTAMLTDTAGIDSATLWDQALHGFSRETLTPSARRNPDPNWSLNPVVAAPHQDALRRAFLLVLRGGQLCQGDEILFRRGPNDYGYHYDVGQDLLCLVLPPALPWLHVTRGGPFPGQACYAAHHGDKYVSVGPEGMGALSEFTLIVLDIATRDPASLVPKVPMASVERRIKCSLPMQEKLDGFSSCDYASAACNYCAGLPPTGLGPQAQSVILPGPDGDEGDKTTTLLTESWPVLQDCDGRIWVQAPPNSEWCDVAAIGLAQGPAPYHPSNPRLFLKSR
jgi:hypothetical protein